MNSQEDKANQDRMMQAKNDTLAAERIRQQGFQDQMTPLNDKALTTLSPEAQKNTLEALQKTHSDATAGAIQDQGAYNPPLASAPNVVNSEIGRKFAEQIGKQRNEATALGNLSGWTDLNLANKIGMQDTKNSMGTIGDFSNSSANLLPFEINANMNNARKAKSGIGDLLGLLGQGVGFANGLGAFNGLGGAASSSGAFVPGGMSQAGTAGPMSVRLY